MVGLGPEDFEFVVAVRDRLPRARQGWCVFFDQRADRRTISTDARVLASSNNAEDPCAGCGSTKRRGIQLSAASAISVLAKIPAEMKAITDCFGRGVRLTDERLAHILGRAEMRDMREEIIHTLQTPEEVRISRTDTDVRLFYEFYSRTALGDKWLCVVVKYLTDGAFVITAYLTDKLKAGERVWPIN